MLLALGTPATAADLPEQLQNNIDKAIGDYDKTGKSADEKLLKAFDAEVTLIRKQPTLKAGAKQEAIEAIGVERDTFEKFGTLPFSSRMRTATLSHIKDIRKFDQLVTTAYDKAIEHLTTASSLQNNPFGGGHHLTRHESSHRVC